MSHISIKDRLEKFIVKYYKNKLLKGLLIFLAFTILVGLFASFIEWSFWFGNSERKLIFYISLFLILTAFSIWVLYPIIQILGVGRKLNYKQAGKIIGTHFAHVQDKLLNLLELEEKNGLDEKRNYQLLEAAIAQKNEELTPIPFNNIIKYSANKKAFIVAGISALVLTVIYLITPQLLEEGSGRLVNYDQEFERPFPYEIELLNEKLEVKENENLELRIKFTSSNIPQQVVFQSSNRELVMKQNSINEFSIKLLNLSENEPFLFEIGPYKSKQYLISVLKKPKVNFFNLNIKYPDYTGFDASKNKGKLSVKVPEGAVLNWQIETDKQTYSKVIVDSSLIEKTNKGFFYTAKKNSNYQLIHQHAESKLSEKNNYTIEVIKDAYPSVSLKIKEDSLEFGKFYFSGKIADDYGLSKLKIYYRTNDKDEFLSANIATNKLLEQSFFYTNVFNEATMLEAYAEVWDNDQVNGAKSSKTQPIKIDVKTLSEKAEEIASRRENVEDKLSDFQKESEKLSEELEQIQNKLKSKKELNFQDKQQIENTVNKFQQLQEQIEENLKENELLNKNENQINEFSEELQEKQKKLEELAENLLDEELQELLKEIQDLLNQQNDEKLLEKMEELEISNEELEQNLDDNLKWMKELALEKKTEDLAKELEKLAEKQEELSKQEAENESELQKEINDDFKKLQEKLGEIEKEHKELETGAEPDSDSKESQENVEESLKESEENLDNNQQKKANKSQKQASEQMQEMANDIKSSQQQAEQEQQAENMEDLRALLENIIQLSFDQENLLAANKAIESNDPRLKEITRNQSELGENFGVVKDSLLALSKRVIQLSGIINKEVVSIERFVKESVYNLKERQIRSSLVYQQKGMTSLNNLALLLDEVLQQMQEQMAKSKPGKSNCEKPGGSGQKPSLSELRKMQEQLNKEMKQGGDKKPGGQKDGQKPGGSEGQAMQIAKQAAKQAAIRKKMQQLIESLESENPGGTKQLKDIGEELEKIEKDIVNQRYDLETQKRQQEIITRFLEAEKALKEQELDNKRQSTTAQQNQVIKNEEELEYLRQKQKELEILKSYPAGMKPYYENKVKQYFKP